MSLMAMSLYAEIMADRGGGRGDRGRGDRGRGRGPRRPRGKKDDEEKWVPCTKLGRLVQQVGPSVALVPVTVRFLFTVSSNQESYPTSVKGCAQCGQQDASRD